MTSTSEARGHVACSALHVACGVLHAVEYAGDVAERRGIADGLERLHDRPALVVVIHLRDASRLASSVASQRSAARPWTLGNCAECVRCYRSIRNPLGGAGGRAMVATARTADRQAARTRRRLNPRNPTRKYCSTRPVRVRVRTQGLARRRSQRKRNRTARLTTGAPAEVGGVSPVPAQTWEAPLGGGRTRG